MSVKDAFENFIADEEAVKKAIDSSTKASWDGISYYVVELFDDGTRRVLWSNQIGNLYDSPGMILPIPALSSEEWDDDPTICYYDNAIELLENLFKEKWQENLEYQAAIASQD